MYTPITGCSTLLHLLISRPILLIFLGFAGALLFVKPIADHSDIEKRINQKADEIIQRYNISPENEKEAISYYQAIVAVELKHPRIDGHGPAGLTKKMANYIAEKMDCESEYAQSLLIKPKLNRMAGFVYFLDLINQFHDIELAVTAYRLGQLRTKLILKKKILMPKFYLLWVKEEKDLN